MTKDMERFRAQPPDQRRALLIALLALLGGLVLMIVLWSGRGDEAGKAGGFVPSPVAPLGPDADPGETRQ